MNIFEQPVEELAYYNDIKDCFKKIGKVPVAFGCVDQQKPHFVSAVGKNFRQKLIITHNEIKARELYEDMSKTSVTCTYVRFCTSYIGTTNGFHFLFTRGYGNACGALEKIYVRKRIKNTIVYETIEKDYSNCLWWRFF